MSADARELPHATRWRPTATVAASMALHGGVAIATVLHLPSWPYALGAIAANHALLGALGLWPRSTLLGPNITRLPASSAAKNEIALTFDDGPDPEVTPRVLDMLDAAGAHASFFCIADEAKRHAALCREIVRRGHAVENHSCSHRAVTFPFYGVGGFRREITSAQHLLAEIAGVAPRFFRAPAGLRNPMLDPVLHELGLRLVSWTRRGYDTRTTDSLTVARRLISGLAAGDILLLHDGHAPGARRAAAPVLAALPVVLAAARRQRLVPVTLHQALRP